MEIQGQRVDEELLNFLNQRIHVFHRPSVSYADSENDSFSSSEEEDVDYDGFGSSWIHRGFCVDEFQEYQRISYLPYKRSSSYIKEEESEQHQTHVPVSTLPDYDMDSLSSFDSLIEGNSSDDEKIEIELPSESYQKSLKLGFQSCFSENLFTDVTLIAEGCKFKCHKIVLCSLSDYFRAMFTVGMIESRQDEIELPESASVVKRLLQYMYSGDDTVTVDYATEMLPAAAYYQVDCLRETCEHALCRSINVKNILEYWRMTSDKYPSCKVLRKVCEKYILREFVLFTETGHVLDLKVHELVFLLTNENLKVPEEELVCVTVDRWFKHDLEGRKKYIRAVFEHVKLPLVGKDYWEFFKRKCPLIEEDAMQKYISETDRFQNNLAGQMDFDSPRTIHRANSNMKEILVLFSAPRIEGDAPRRVGSYSFTSERWSTHGQVPRGTQHGYSTTNYGDFYIMLTGGSKSDDVWLYDGMDAKWHEFGNLPSERSDHCSVPVGNYVYILGGMSYSYSKRMFTFEPSIVKCCPKVSRKWSRCGKLVEPVTFSNAVALKDKIYVFGGFSPNSTERPAPVSTVQCYDTRTEQTTVVSEMPFTPDYIRTAVHGDAIYIVGGGQIQLFHPNNDNDSNGTYDIIVDDCCLNNGFGMLKDKNRLIFIGVSSGMNKPSNQMPHSPEAFQFDFKTKLLSRLPKFDLPKRICGPLFLHRMTCNAFT